MIQKLAVSVTDFFVSKSIIDKSESDIYVYGFDLIISGLTNKGNNWDWTSTYWMVP